MTRIVIDDLLFSLAVYRDEKKVNVRNTPVMPFNHFLFYAAQILELSQYQAQASSKPCDASNTGI